MTNSNLEICSTNNFKHILFIVSLFNENLQFYSSTSFRSNLHNRNTLFFYLKKKNSVRALFLVEKKKRILYSYNGLNGNHVPNIQMKLFNE